MMEQTMLSRDLYLSLRDGPAQHDPLTLLAAGLGIRRDRCLDGEEKASHYRFFRREENTLFFWEVAGDFRFKVDVYLFDLDAAALERRLLQLSAEGLVVAGDDDEKTEDPYAMLLFENGRKRKVVVFGEDEVRIWEKNTERG